jgi:hypothetical protein
MIYGSDTHAESAAAIFSLVPSCRLHAIDPHQYLNEVIQHDARAHRTDRRERLDRGARASQPARWGRVR